MPVNALTASDLATAAASLGQSAVDPELVLSDYTLDNGMQVFPNLCDRIYVCSGLISDFNSVISSALGYKNLGAGSAFGAIADGSPQGRVVSSTAFTDGTVTGTGNAITWAAVDFAGSQLLAWGVLQQPVGLLSGQLFGLPSFTIHEFAWISGGTVVGISVNYFAPLQSNFFGKPSLAQTHNLSAQNLASHSASVGVPNMALPTQYADGLSGAPQGTPQYAGMLNSYGTANRPPWNVAGVDYAVGVMPGITMLDPTVQANLPTNATADAANKVVNITGPCNFGSPTQGFQFPTDWYIHITSAASGNVLIQNCSITMDTQASYGIASDANLTSLTILNCEVNGSSYASVASPTQAGGIATNGNGSIKIHYCWVHNLPVDALDISNGANSFDIQYNALYAFGYTPGTNGGHPDSLQLVAGNISSGVFAFNLCVQPTGAVVDQNPILDIEAQLGGIVSSVEYANNTIIAQGTTGGASGSTTPASICCGSFVDDTTSQLQGFQFIHNYVDPTGSIWGMFGTPAQCAGTSGYPLIYRGNYCMKAFNDGTGDVFPLGPCDPAKVGRVPAGSTTATAGLSDYDVLSVSANPASGNVGVGGTITFTVNYARTVSAGLQSLSLSNGATANYVSGNNSKSLNFSYTVQSSDGSVANLAITALNGTYKDKYGNAMDNSQALATFTGLSVNASSVALTANNLATKAAGIGKPAISQNVAGSYNNLNHWPSLANRPVYNKTSKVLTWIGPAGGGASTSNDIQQTATLTPQTSAITTSVDGQIIQNLAISTPDAIQITVSNNNVTIRRCYIECSTGPSNANGFYNIWIDPNVTGTVIEDCEINGNGPLQSANNGSGTFNIICDPGGNFTVQRCNLYGYEQMVARNFNNANILDNYMHDVAGVDADMIEMYDDQGPMHDVLIQHNTFNQTTNFAGYNSEINMSTNWNPANLPAGTNGIYNITVNNNRFLWIYPNSFTHVICDDNRGYNIAINWICTNNGILDTMSTIFWDHDSTLNQNSGNFSLADTADTTITGSPYNGTGQV